MSCSKDFGVGTYSLILSAIGSTISTTRTPGSIAKSGCKFTTTKFSSMVLTLKHAFGKTLKRVPMPTYLPRKHKDNLRANPGMADPNNLSSRARIFVVFAEHDSLTFANENWLKHMRAAGKDKLLTIYEGKGMKHGWCNLPERWLSREQKRVKFEAYEHMYRFWDETLRSNNHNEKGR